MEENSRSEIFVTLFVTQIFASGAARVGGMLMFDSIIVRTTNYKNQ